MGLTAALATGLIVLVLGLVAISQRLLHDRAFAPTMATHHLVGLVSSKQLVAALSGIIPGEQLEDAGMNEDFEIDVPGGNSKPNSPALSALRSYIQAITKANQLERLIKASDDLKESPLLQSLFYTYALSYALDVASRDQLIQLIHSSLLPGPAVTARVFKVGGDWDMGYPATLVFLRIVAKRKLLDRAILDGILSKCPEKSNCVARAKLVAARVLALAQPANLDYLLPIPPSFHRVEIVANGATSSQLQSVPLVRGAPLTGDDLAYISWIAKHDAWHNSTANGISAGTPMSWAELSPSLSPSINRVKGEQVNHLLHFIVQALWLDGIPDRDLSQLKLLIPKQVQLDKLDQSERVPYVADQAMDEFLTRERPRTRCSDLHGIDGDELLRRSSELSNDGVSCLQRDSSQLRERNFLSNLQSVAQESGMLFGESGRLQKFGKLQIPGSATEIARQTLFGMLFKGLCEADTGAQEDLIPGATERPLLVAALQLLTVPAMLPQEVVQWKERIFSGEPCLGMATAGDVFKQRVTGRARAMTFEIADWLYHAHPAEALVMMRFLSGTLLDPGVQLPPYADELAKWFFDHGFAVDTLDVTAANTLGFRILRRAAWFRVASCEYVAGATSRAREIATLAEASGVLVRQVALPEDALPTIRTEAEYYSSIEDWRRAVAVCEQCGATDKTRVAATLIGPLASRSEGVKPPKSLNCEEFTKEGYDLFWTRQMKTEPGVSSLLLVPNRNVTGLQKWLHWFEQLSSTYAPGQHILKL
jgi:hypothetical protein